MERDGPDVLAVSEKLLDFSSVNQDIAIANTIYQSALDRGIGTRLPHCLTLMVASSTCGFFCYFPPRRAGGFFGVAFRGTRVATGAAAATRLRG